MQLLQRLQQKRTALEKELGKVPGAPSSKKDVFHLCRGFERAFTHLLEVGRYGVFIQPMPRLHAHKQMTLCHLPWYTKVQSIMKKVINCHADN